MCVKSNHTLTHPSPLYSHMSLSTHLCAVCFVHRWSACAARTPWGRDTCSTPGPTRDRPGNTSAPQFASSCKRSSSYNPLRPGSRVIRPGSAGSTRWCLPVNGKCLPFLRSRSRRCPAMTEVRTIAVSGWRVNNMLVHSWRCSCCVNKIKWFSSYPLENHVRGSLPSFRFPLE